ncbi:hypothetical protein PHISP_01721 [Aspergillus sp. HF37]|nr:hypothetical protein PHISP_01721 [Aspergillus sp. HF37]
MAQSEELLDAPDGSALTWIFDHCLRYPGTYEIPLRTMYAMNCNSMRQQGARPRDSSSTSRSSQSSKSSQSSHDPALDPAADFKAQLTHQIARLPSQPCSLPPSFTTTFMRRCFAPHFEEADFHQALTSLDYLKDLELRRRREVTAALQRLGLQPGDLKSKTDLAKEHPNVLSWAESIDAKAKKVESLYSHIYIGLRRWTLVSEMLTEPYNKANCIAMLNTLFPPVTESAAATPQLTPQVLKTQRDGLFRYISAIDTNGKKILDQVIQHGAQPGQPNGWPLVRDALDKYLRNTNDMIDACAVVKDPASLEEEESRRKGYKGHKGHKPDSGVSFGATSISSGNNGISNNNSTESVLDKPLPPSPAEDPRPKSGGSTLERLTRELRKLGESGKSKELKKMKSSSTLASRSENHPSHSADSSFNIDEQKRRRLVSEANTRKRTHSKQSSSDSHK